MPDLRGWMIDAARLPESLSHYRRVIDQCAAAGLNAILFRLADDQGSALRFDSHPELDVHPHAFSPQELSALAGYALGQGIDLIPEVESFGHTGFITRCLQHQHLLDEDPHAHAHFTGVIPTHPDTLSLLADLYAEVARIFPSPYLHAGCDEVNWGSSTYSQHLIAAKGRPVVWADHINALHEIARQNDRQLMIWADHPLYTSPDILPLLDRRIILVDWNYWETDPQVILERAQCALQAGFSLVGAPAWIWCRWSVRPGASQLDNIDAFGAAYARLDDPACLGLLVTNWVPGRWLNGAQWDGPAYAGFRTSDQATADRSLAFRSFIRQHYQADWSVTWEELYARLFIQIPPRRGCAGTLPGPYQPELWHDLESLNRCLSQPAADSASLQGLLDCTRRCQPLVTANQVDFLALLCSLEFLLHLHVRTEAIQRAAQDGALPPSRVLGTLNLIASADETLSDILLDDWLQTRFPDDPALGHLLPRLDPGDQVLFNLRQAAGFTRQLPRLP